MQLKRFSNGQLITLNSELASGGEGRIYTVLEEPSLVAKVYHANKLTTTQTDKLRVMFVNPPDNLAAQRNISIAWPVDLLLPTSSSQQIVGFLMQRLAGMHPIHEFYASGYRRKISPFFNYLYLHHTAYNLAVAIRNLHNRGYVIGDVNESNILVSDTSWVTLVDTDSFQVCDLTKGVVYRCPVGKPEFTPPELQGQTFRNIDRSREHDLFGLAVLIFKLLMEGTHPFNGEFISSGEMPSLEQRIKAGHFPYGTKSVPYRPSKIAPPFEILHPKLQQLFMRCFDDGHNNPMVRPDAGNWLSVLKDAKNDLVTCSVNAQHRYGSHLRACPWCERKVQLGGRDPFPSQHPMQAGQYQKLVMPKQIPLPSAQTQKKPTQPTTPPQVVSPVTNSKKSPSNFAKGLLVLTVGAFILINGSKFTLWEFPFSSSSGTNKSALFQAGLPAISQDKGVTLEVRSARQQGGFLVLDVSLKNEGTSAVTFLYSFLDVTDNRGRALQASTEGLPTKLPPNSQPVAGTVSIPTAELDGAEQISLTLTDYPDQQLRLQTSGIPVR